LDGEFEEIVMRSARGHSLPVFFLPSPLKGLITPLLRRLRACPFIVFRLFEYSNHDRVFVLLDGRPCPHPITKLFAWEEEDLLGRLDLLLWYLAYHHARQESLRPEFAANFNWSGRFDVRITQEKRLWKCPDCEHAIAGGDWWCLHPICPSRARLVCATGWTPPLILVRESPLSSQESPSWYQTLARMRHALPAS
jgi:hypothetical protein